MRETRSSGGHTVRISEVFRHVHPRIWGPPVEVWVTYLKLSWYFRRNFWGVNRTSDVRPELWQLGLKVSDAWSENFGDLFEANFGSNVRSFFDGGKISSCQVELKNCILRYRWKPLSGATKNKSLAAQFRISRWQLNSLLCQHRPYNYTIVTIFALWSFWM